MVSALNITREQLARFLGSDARAIKQFENLFANVNEVTDVALVELLVQVGSALAGVNEALAGLQSLADSLDKGPPSVPVVAEPDLSPVPNFVSSVDISGGTTGLSFSGGPVRSFGTFTMAGTLVAANGGTGLASYAVGDLIYASGATTLSKLADVATGNALISGGVGVAPSWGKIGLTTHVTGVLPVANGGSGVGALGNITKADDTNVTLTLGGTPTGAVINSTSFTLGWTGTLAVARGGTGGSAASGTLLDNITGFASTGHLVRTAAGTYAFRTQTGTANQITVTNGSGVSGNPTYSLPSTVILTSATYAGSTGYIATQGDNIERMRVGHYDSAGVSFPTGLVSAQILAGVTVLEISTRDNAAAVINFRVGSGVTVKATLTSTALNIASGVNYQVAGTQVVTSRRTGWGAATGTATRTAIATYTAPTISSPPTQAEVQAIADALQAWSRRDKALSDDLTTHGLIGA